MLDPKSKKRAYAHRVAWELVHGPIPDGQRILHTCDNPICVNPAHLVRGTQQANIHDSLHKGRHGAWGRLRLSAERVRAIRHLAAQGMLQKDIAKRYGVARNTISQVVSRTTWPHVDPLDAVFERVPHRLVPVRGEVA